MRIKVSISFLSLNLNRTVTSTFFETNKKTQKSMLATQKTGRKLIQNQSCWQHKKNKTRRKLIQLRE